MNTNNINFDDKKIKKKEFYKSKKVFEIDNIDVNKILVSKKSRMVQKMLLNTLSDIMIMILIDHYV